MPGFSALFAVALALAGRAWAQADREVVRVNGTPIRQSEVMDRLWKRFGPETLQEMIDELLLRQSAQAAKIKAEPAEVTRRLKRLEARVGDAKLLEAQLEQSGSTVELLKADLSDAIAREKLVVKQKKLTVKDEELKSAFEANRQALGRPLAVRLRHILVKSEQEARDLARQVKEGGDFAALAREKSLAPTAGLGGDLGFVSKGMIPPDWEPVVFKMKPKEIRVLKVEHGAHVVEALERREEAPAEFPRVKEELRETLLQEKVSQALPAYLKELRASADIKTQGR